MTSPSTPHSVDAGLRLGDGLNPDERPGIVATFASLDRRLKSYPAGSVELLLTVKERDTPSQRTTLLATIAGTPDVVANSTSPDLGSALIEVREDLIRQITDAKNKTEARNNPRLRLGRADKRAGDTR
ncbi:MAG: HPF/RaiA family ribosome-associated protein [Ilumatobacteraceae bacterium]